MDRGVGERVGGSAGRRTGVVEWWSGGVVEWWSGGVVGFNHLLSPPLYGLPAMLSFLIGRRNYLSRLKK